MAGPPDLTLIYRRKIEISYTLSICETESNTMPNKAIIVGIQAYAELPPVLQGPKNDAKRFFDWVTSKGGVDPDPKDAKLILGDEPPPAVALNGRPTAEAIKYEFDLLEEEAKRSAS